ncbi:MAG: protoglobin domain-containing protein, partial [Acidobacteriota bacterium]
VGQDLGQRHAMIADWFVELFAGRYDQAYAERRLAIGATHVRIGLPVRYPLAMLDIVLDHGHRVTTQGDDPEVAARAFAKVLAIDVAIFNHAYEHHQLRHLAELVGGERLARRVLTGES